MLGLGHIFARTVRSRWVGGVWPSWTQWEAWTGLGTPWDHDLALLVPQKGRLWPVPGRQSLPNPPVPAYAQHGQNCVLSLPFLSKNGQ